MRFRCIRKIDTGQWLNVLFTVDGDRFSVKQTSHRADIAKALGVTRTSLEVVDAASDPRTGILIEIPPAPEPQPTTPREIALARIQALLQINRSDWTDPERAELLELIARN